MKAAFALARQLEAGRVPVNYIVAHLPKDQQPLYRKFLTTPLFNAMLSPLGRGPQSPQLRRLQPNAVNLWLRALEGRRVSKSKLVNRNRDTVIELLELFCKPDVFVIVSLGPALQLPAARPFLVHSLLAFLARCEVAEPRNPHVEKLLAPHLEGCPQIGGLLANASPARKFGFFYFLGKGPLEGARRAEQLARAREQLEAQGNLYNSFLDDKLADERLKNIAVRRWANGLDVDPVLRKFLLQGFASDPKVVQAQFLLDGLAEFVDVYAKHRHFFERNFILEED